MTPDEWLKFYQSEMTKAHKLDLELATKLQEQWAKNFPAVPTYKGPIVGAINHNIPINFTFAPAKDGRKFDPQQDLPNPRPGDVCQGADGSYWYALSNDAWAEFQYDYMGNATPTGKTIDVRNRVVTPYKPEEKTVQNSTAKTPTCNRWSHKWKTYVGLTGINSFEYCEVCDEKRVPEDRKPFDDSF